MAYVVQWAWCAPGSFIRAPGFQPEWRDHQRYRLRRQANGAVRDYADRVRFIKPGRVMLRIMRGVDVVYGPVLADAIQ